MMTWLWSRYLVWNNMMYVWHSMYLVQKGPKWYEHKVQIHVLDPIDCQSSVCFALDGRVLFYGQLPFSFRKSGRKHLLYNFLFSPNTRFVPFNPLWSWGLARSPHRALESGLRLVSGPGSCPPLNTWLRHTSEPPETRPLSVESRHIHCDNMLLLCPSVTRTRGDLITR